MNKTNQLQLLTEKRKAEAKKMWWKTEVVFFIFSFVLPYFMGLFYYLTSKNELEDVFNRAQIIKYTLVGVAVLFSFTFIAFYLFFNNQEVFMTRSTKWIVTSTFFLAYTISSILAHTLSDYAVPLVFCGLIIMLLVDKRLAYIVNVLAPVLYFMCYATINPKVELFQACASALVQIVSGCFVLVFSQKRYTRLSFLARNFLVGICVAFPLAFLASFMEADAGWKAYVTSGVFAFISIMISFAFFMVLTPLYEVMFRLYSNFRLEELCTADAPLLERLAKEAPGTYNHSVAMSVLAQDCAKAIGENSSLAKAGACYHDIGKLYNPICFSENQTTYNPHDDYIPEVSVAMITRHTSEGAQMIRKYRLPEALAQIAEEHHGDQTVSYFFNKSLKMTDETMNVNLFRYKGPRPSTKISGIIMIVDTVEAATRAQGINKDAKLFQAFIHKLIYDKVNAGQFSDCPLTYKDLTIIEETLIKTLPSIYHQRIKYTK